MIRTTGKGWNGLHIQSSGKDSKASHLITDVDWSAVTKTRIPTADLRRYYSKAIKVSLIASLSILILGFQLARNVVLDARPGKEIDVKIEVADIPITEQFRKPPPPQRPSLPIPTDEEAIPEDLTIESTDLDLTEIPPPPAPPDDDDDMSAIFVAYDQAPQIIGGMAAVSYNLVYPPLAQKSGVECTVVAKVLVTKEGISKRVEILQVTSAGFGFEESAIAALQKVKWKPALQRDRAINTWVAIPVKFRLTN